MRLHPHAASAWQYASMFADRQEISGPIACSAVNGSPVYPLNFFTTDSTCASRSAASTSARLFAALIRLSSRSPSYPVCAMLSPAIYPAKRSPYFFKRVAVPFGPAAGAFGQSGSP